MKLQVTYPTGASHVVELTNAVATLGRDPGSDLVLYDIKCSRRHAVVEETAQGLQIRDAGSSNGTFVNGRRADRAWVRPGDEIRIGEVILRVLGEEPEPAAEGTIAPPVAAVSTHSDTGRLAGFRDPPDRALRILAYGWLAFAPLFVLAAVAAVYVSGAATARGAAAGIGTFLFLWSLLLGYGLLRRRTWARPMQLVSAGVGLFLCPVFTILSLVVLVYMLRADTALLFDGAAGGGRTPESDRPHALLISVALALAAVLLVLGVAYTIYTSVPRP
jgi:hypothetical protein